MADSKIEVIIEAIDNATAVFNSVGKSAQNFSSSMESVGKKLTLGVTAPLVGLGVLGVKAFGDFNAEIERSGAFVNASAEQVEKFRNVAIEAAKGTKFSALESATALGAFVGGEITAEEASRSLGDVINIALVAKMSNLQEATNLSSTALIQFKNESLTLTDVMDVMATVAANVTVQTSEYSRELVQIMAPARLAGLSFKETNMLLSGLVSSGAQLSTVGTSINKALKAISDPSKDAKIALESVNLSVKGLQNALSSGPLQLLEYLKQGFDKAQESGQGAVWVNQVLGAGATDFTLALGRENEELQKVPSYFEDIYGKGATLSQKIRENIPALDKLTQVFSVLILKIGQELNPMIEKLTVFIQNNQDKMTEWVKIFIDTAIPMLAKVGEFLKLLFDKFASLDDGVKKNIATVIILLAILAPLMVILGLLLPALSVIISPIGILTAAIIFLVTHLDLVNSKIDILKDKLQMLKETFLEIKPTLDLFWQVFKDWIQPSVDKLFITLQTKLLPSLIELWGVIKGTLLPALESLWPVVKFLAEVIGLALFGAITIVIQQLIVLLDYAAKGASILMWFAKLLVNEVSREINVFVGTLNTIVSTLRSIYEWGQKAARFMGGGFNAVTNKVSDLMVPFMAEGGIVTSPTLAMVGESGPEAIIPLNRTRGMGSITVNINGGTYLSENVAERIGDMIINKLQNSIRI